MLAAVQTTAYLLKKDRPWNSAREKRTSWREVLSPERRVRPSMLARTTWKKRTCSKNELQIHPYKRRMFRDARSIRNCRVKSDVSMTAKEDPVEREKTNSVV
jgi:hypothetical protein